MMPQGLNQKVPMEMVAPAESRQFFPPPSPNLPFSSALPDTKGYAMGSQSSRPEPDQPAMAQDQGKLSSVTEPVDDDEPDEW